MKQAFTPRPGDKTVCWRTCGCRYDPKTDMWTTVSSLSVSRDAVGVCLLGDRLYAVGGYDGQSYLNTVESYDAQNNEWTEVNKHKSIGLSISDLSKVSQCSFRFGEHSWLRNAGTWSPQEHRLSAVSRLLFSFSFLSAWNKMDFFFPFWRRGECICWMVTSLSACRRSLST